MKIREISNVKCLDFIDYYIENLYVNANTEKDTFAELAKKLSVDEYELLNHIGTSLLLIKLAKLKASTLYDQAQKTGDLKPYLSAQKLKEKLEIKLNEKVESIEKTIFVQFCGNFITCLARIRGSRDLGRLVSLDRSWRRELKNVQKKVKYKNKQQQTKELLKIIAGDKIANIEELVVEEQEEIKRYGHLLSVQAFVNLDEELDLQNLSHGPYFIETMALHGGGMPQIIEEDRNSLHVSIDGKSEQISLREYFRREIPTLSKEILRSKDLLDNILIIYITKLAQGGNSEAYNFLYSCYEKEAEGKSLRFIKSKAANLGLEFGGMLNDENVIAVGRTILSLLLKGDSPHMVLKYLAQKDAKPSVDIMLNRWLHKIIMESYEQGFITLQAAIQVCLLYTSGQN